MKEEEEAAVKERKKLGPVPHNKLRHEMPCSQSINSLSSHGALSTSLMKASAKDHTEVSLSGADLLSIKSEKVT